MSHRRQAWSDAQPDFAPECLVFIDEIGASTKMMRLRGRAPHGQRCRAAVPHGHWKTTTFVGALCLNGMTAPLVLDGPMNGAAFLAYVQQRLAPTLKRGVTVIMDLPAQKVAGVRAAIKATGARMCLLPPYSPDFNPIENAFATLKALLRKASARTVPDLWAATGPQSPTHSHSSHQPSAPTTSLCVGRTASALAAPPCPGPATSPQRPVLLRQAAGGCATCPRPPLWLAGPGCPRCRGRRRRGQGGRRENPQQSCHTTDGKRASPARAA